MFKLLKLQFLFATFATQGGSLGLVWSCASRTFKSFKNSQHIQTTLYRSKREGRLHVQRCAVREKGSRHEVVTVISCASPSPSAA